MTYKLSSYCLKGFSGLENSFPYTPLGNSDLTEEVLLFRILVSLEDLSCPALHREPTDVNGHCVMLYLPCGGAAAKLHIYC